MNALLTCHRIGKAYGSRTLFQNITYSIMPGDRIGIVGPNGTGKSTFLKALAGLTTPDEGQISQQKNLHVSYIPQHPKFAESTIEDILIQELHQHPHAFYDAETQAQITLGKMGFPDPQQKTTTLSGGWIKRLALAQKWATSPDLLLLDEPTNHLDLESILWLEKQLERAPFAYLIISHDRRFLENTCNQIIELSPQFPNGLFSVKGHYSDFLEKRNTFLEGQERLEQRLKGKLQREIDWLRTSPKARTTKSRSRIEDAHQLQQTFKEVKARNTNKQGQISFASTQRQTKRLLTAKNISKKRGDRLLFEKVDLTLSPGSRLGIVGPNGSGKSTLLKVLNTELTADTGTIKYAENLRLVTFDQQRLSLPQDITLREALSMSGSDMIRYNNQSIHVNAWAQRFLFEPNRLDLPVKQLSGGEQARVLIARLMQQPTDILFLDEPTNDLDIPTLELLEESLAEFEGAVVLITHDRLMLDQVCDTLIAVGTDLTGQHFADSFQWEAALEAHTQTDTKEKKVVPKAPPKPKAKLSYKEKQELATMEERVLELEEELESLHKKIDHAEADQLVKLCKDVEEKQETLDTLYQRWQELEDKKSIYPT